MQQREEKKTKQTKKTRKAPSFVYQSDTLDTNREKKREQENFFNKKKQHTFKKSFQSQQKSPHPMSFC